MKKFNLFYLLGLMVCFSFVSCSDDDDNASDESYLQILAGVNEFTYAGGTGRISLNSTAYSSNIVATCDASWISNIEIDEYRITFVCAANDSMEARTATFTITADDISESYIIEQAGIGIVGIDEDLEYKTDGGTFEIEYNTTQGTPTVVIPGSAQTWLTYTIGTSTIVFTITENTDPIERTADITITVGDTTVTISFIQEAAELTLAIDKLFEETTFESDKLAGSVTLTPIAENLAQIDGYTYVVNDDWLTAEMDDDGNLKISYSRNNTDDSRQGSVTIYVDGIVLHVITITQTTESGILDTWILNYKDSSQDDQTLELTVNLNEDTNEYYLYGFLSRYDYVLKCKVICYYENGVLTMPMQYCLDETWSYNSEWCYSEGYYWVLSFGFKNSYYYYLDTYADYFWNWAYEWTMDETGDKLTWGQNAAILADEDEGPYALGFNIDIRDITVLRSWETYGRVAYCGDMERYVE